MQGLDRRQRTTLMPGSLKELACYLPVLLGALFGFPSPIGMAFAMVFGLLMGALMIKVVRLDMERFSRGLLLGIVAAAVFCAYLIFLLIFGLLYNWLSPPIQSLIGHFFKH
jgi:membrane protein required for beta-lactamase induction